jgi:HD-GYP domain-containing protein (c-di-GMP phosphodiesterase class II)
MSTSVNGKQIYMSDLIFAISEAMDITHHSLALHQLRTAYICWQMAEEAKLSPAQAEKLFLAAVLHDVGALTASEKIEHYEFEDLDSEAHCLRGELVYKQVPWLAPSARIVRLHHTPWKYYSESINAPDILEAQILALAEILERAISRDVYILHQSGALQDRIRGKAGTDIHETVVDLFLQASIRESFWLDLVSPALQPLLRSHSPIGHIRGDSRTALNMEELFIAIIDFQSRYTAAHSAGVYSCADSLCELFGLPEIERVDVRLAAMLHDLGKIGVPNEILEKPGKVTPEEFAIIKMHSYLTFRLLDGIRGFGDVARIAGNHHEGLDGGGYPFHIKGDDLSTSSRIVAVADVITALSEHRPYRGMMSPKEIRQTMKDMVKRRQLDSRVVETLLDNIDGITLEMREKQEPWKDRYHDVLSITGPSSRNGLH